MGEGGRWRTAGGVGASSAAHLAVGGCERERLRGRGGAGGTTSAAHLAVFPMNEQLTKLRPTTS